MDRRSALKKILVGTSVVAATEGLARAFLFLKEHSILRESIFVRKIEGVEIFVNGEIADEKLEKILKYLENMLSFLPKKITQRIHFIQLNFLSKKNEKAAGLAYLEIDGIEIKLKKEILSLSEEGIETEVARILFHEIIHLITYKYHELKIQDAIRTVSCEISSLENCMSFFTDLIDNESLSKWLDISKLNGGYLTNSRFFQLDTLDISNERLTSPNFGYPFFQSAKFRYGVLNLLEDIACVFQQVIHRLYLVYKKGKYDEDEAKREINALLAETPNETGLWEKYLIACKSLSSLFQDEQKQESDPANKTKLGNLINVLQVFSKQIQDAIDGKLVLDKKQPNNQQLMAYKFGGATTGQRDQQSASVGQGDGQQIQQISITRREFLKESLRQLFRGGDRRII